MKHLTVGQRYTISVMLQKGYTQKQIAEAIGKDKSTVSREIRRNCDARSGAYRHELAQRKCDKRHQTKPKKIRFTEQVKAYVDTLLKNDFSPEQIAGRAKLEKMECVSHERIYQYVWADKKSQRFIIYPPEKERAKVSKTWFS
jgi:IS30 family transposase